MGACLLVELFGETDRDAHERWVYTGDRGEILLVMGGDEVKAAVWRPERREG